MYVQLKDTSDADDRRVNATFALLGFCYLFPFWAMVQPVDFWLWLFPTSNVEFDISCAYSMATVVTLTALVCWLGHPKRYNAYILSGLSIQVAVLAILPIIVLFSSAKLAIVVVATVLLAIATSLLDSSVFGMASMFPAGAMEHVQIGIGVSGLFAAMFRLLSKACLESSMIAASAIVYFLLGAIAVGFAIPAYLSLRRLSWVSERCAASDKQQLPSRRLLQVIGVNETLVALSYATTHIVYPGVVSSLDSFDWPHLNQHGWWQLILLTIYSVAEVLGRVAARYRFGIGPSTVWRIIVARFLLIPPLVCASMHVIFTNDIVCILLVTLLAFSGGYCGTVALVVIRDLVQEEDVCATGMVSSLSINVGLVVGSIVGYVMSWLLHIS